MTSLVALVGGDSNSNHIKYDNGNQKVIVILVFTGTPAVGLEAASIGIKTMFFDTNVP